MSSKRKDEFLFGCIELAVSRYSCADVWQTIGNGGLELRKKVVKNWTRLMNEQLLKLNLYA